MDKLLTYLNALDYEARAVFCAAVGTSERYLRKAVSKKQQLGVDYCINIERASLGQVVCEDLLPSVDWAYVRGTAASVHTLLESQD